MLARRLLQRSLFPTGTLRPRKALGSHAIRWSTRPASVVPFCSVHTFHSDAVTGDSPIDLTPPGLLGPDAIAALGYWPTDAAIRVLDFVHTTTGLPWWATIIAATIGTDILIYPLRIPAIRASLEDNKKKLVNAEGRIALDPFLPMGAVLTVDYGFWRALNCLDQYAPDFAAPALWLPSLAASDPTWALQLAYGLYAIFSHQSILACGFFYFQPAGMAIRWLTLIIWRGFMDRQCIRMLGAREKFTQRKQRTRRQQRKVVRNRRQLSPNIPLAPKQNPRDIVG